MSWADSLIKLSTYEVENRQLRLTEIARKRADAETRLRVLIAEGEAESKRATQDAEAGIWHDHGFNVLEGQGDEAVVHVETLTRGLTITDPADVAAYKDAFSRLRKLAVTGADAVEILRRIAHPQA